MRAISSSLAVSLGSATTPGAGVGGTSDAHGLCGNGDAGMLGVNANAFFFSIGAGVSAVVTPVVTPAIESSFRSSVTSLDSTDSATLLG